MTLKILFVEDEENTVCGAESGLIRRGHHVEFSHCVNEAETIIKNETFDLIVFDIRLPISCKNDAPVEQFAGLKLVKKFNSGKLGSKNFHAKFAIYTNQRRSIASTDSIGRSNFLGIFSKNQYRRFMRYVVEKVEH